MAVDSAIPLDPVMMAVLFLKFILAP